MDAIFTYAIAAIFFAVSLSKSKEKTKAAATKGLKALTGILPQMATVLIVISIGLALLDPETISRYIGNESGWVGALVAGLLGSVTLIPGFVAFPAAGELLRNGAGTLQVAAFVSTLMMVGVVTLPMEISYFGKRAAIARNALALLFSFGAAAFVAWAVSL
jgi:uncharacterized membrane protein YraQ (UPF0718 family)